MATRSPHPATLRASPAPALAGLVAVLTLMTLELVRSSGPLLDLAYGRWGLGSAAGAAVVTYLAPGPIAALVLSATRQIATRPGSPGSTKPVLLVGAGLLAGLRLVVQSLEAGARFAVGLATVAVGVAVLTLAVAILAGRSGGGRSAAAAVSAGGAAGVGLQLALGTWDAYWRHTLLGWSVTVAVAGSLVWLAVLAGRDPATAPTRRTGRVWVLGPLLALSVVMLANPAFAASQSGLPLAIAGPLNALGLLLAGWTVTHSSWPTTPRTWGARALWSARWAFGGALVLLVAGALSLGGSAAFDGVLVLLALLGAQVTAVHLVSSALEPAPGPALVPVPVLASGALRAESRVVSYGVAATAGLVGLGAIVPVLVYQIDYNIPLGFPNELVLVATAAALGLAGLRRPAALAEASAGDSGRERWPLFAASCALVLAGTAISGAAWAANRPRVLSAAEQSGAGSGAVVSWNVHYGVTPAGSVDLEAIARTVEAQDPDAVLLQEVSRGWVQGGGADMATWLANRLGRQFVFAPAADRRFGNVIMSREEPENVEVHQLPYGDGPQNRSAVSAQVRVGNRAMGVTSVHLQVRRANTPTRIRQLESLLSAPAFGEGPGPGPAMIIGGDLNAEPGWPEIKLLTDAGFVSALDVVGDSTALTAPSSQPTRRIDWVFGRGVAFRDAKVLTDAQSSDHLPLVVSRAP